MKLPGARATLMVTLTLVVALLGWWSVLLFRLANESYSQSVRIHGEAAEASRQLERRRTMIAGESAAMLAATLVLLGLGWRSLRVEEMQAERLRVLLAASTHELKTPIAGVRALLESLRSGVLPIPDAGPHLDSGIAACDRLQHLAEGMLVRQAVLAGESPTETKTLEAWVAPVLARRALLRAEQRVVVSLGEAAAHRLSLPGEAMRVVLDNLLDNAATYAPGGEVRVDAHLDGGRVRIDVVDQGAGFPPQDAERLFRPWERGRRAGTPGGTGLGLYLARSIVHEAGGELRASSAGPGRGATFTLVWPVSEVA
jgi:signal transduction histidine kinase